MRRLSLSYILLIFIGYINAQVIENPVFDRTDVPAFRVHKIEIKRDTTYVCCSYSAEAGSWANISKEMCLYVKKINKKYPILRCDGLPFSPQKKTFANDTRCDVLLCFPPIRNISKFDLIEKENETAFNIYGIDLASQYETIYQESDVARFSNMASFYESVSDTIKALQYKLKEIEAVKYIHGITSEDLSFCLTNAAIMCYKFGCFEQAIDLVIQDNIIVSELRGKSTLDYATSLSTLGMFYSRAKKYDRAIQTYKESIHLFESLNIVDNEYVLALFQIARNYYEIGDNDNALLYQKKSLGARRQIGEVEGYLNELDNVLLAGPDKTRINRIQVVENELASLPSFVGGDYLPLVKIYKEIASQYSLMGNNINAIEYCNKAISVINSNEQDISEDYAELLALKCKCQQYSGQIDEAIVSGEAAKRLYDSLNIKTLKYAECLGDLASAYGNKLNYEKSVLLQLAAVKIYQDTKDWMSLAEVYGAISSYCQFAEKLDDAEQYIKKAINVLNEHDNAEQYIMDAVEQTGNNMINNPDALASIKIRINIDKSNFHSTLARIYKGQGKYTDAINTQLKSVKYAQETSDNECHAMSLSELSICYSNNNQYREAISCLEKAVQLLGDDLGLKLELAFLYWQTGDTIKAIRFAEETISSSKSRGDNEFKVYAMSLLSVYYYQNHNICKAEKYLSEALDYLKLFISSEFKDMTTAQKERKWGRYEKFFLCYRKIIERSDRNATLLSKLYDNILFSKSLLLDSEIQQDFNNTSRLSVKWNDIQQRLHANAIAIEFIVIASDSPNEKNHHSYYALVIDKYGLCPRMINLFCDSQLEEIKKSKSHNFHDNLGKLIWKPILDQYTTVKDIYFSADGTLHMLPIEYYSADGINDMHENYNMYRLTSTKELVWTKVNQHTNSAILYGGLDYNQLKENTSESNLNETSNLWRGIVERGGFDPLFNTALETQEINDLLMGKNISTTLYNGEVGTEESFRSLSGQNHSIIHLATHGMYINPDDVGTKKEESILDFLESLTSIDDPVKEDIALTHSFLVMAGGNRVVSRIPVSDKKNDGILTSKEISQLDLRGLDLVVLSACETALGDINYNGVYGLQRGFKKAGANAILMSLNKVDDEATRILMVEFYRNLMNGKTKRQSLYDAQQYLRKVDNGKYDDPKYWASFIMLDGLN